MKKHTDDRVLLPGDLHVGKPNIGNRQRFLDRVNQVLDSCRLTNNGPFVKELEKKIAEMHQTKHCIVVSNGTTGLGIAIKALDLKGEVIIPSLTFIATAHALKWQGIEPVFCDIDPKTYNIDPDQVEIRISDKTTGIIGVHLWGRPCDVEKLQNIAEKHNLKLMYDAAHAFGCSCNGRMIGAFGDIEVFSFHATKVFNTAEGGAILTNNSDLAEKIEYMRDFGFAGYDKVIHLGINGKMNEFLAALGLTNLESYNDFIEINQRNYLEYQKLIQSIPGLNLLKYNESDKNNWQYIICEVDEEKAGISRDELIVFLHANRILARKYFWPGCHRMEPYKTLYPHASEYLKHTEEISDRIIVLPTGTGVNVDEIKKICLLLKSICKGC